MKKILFTFFAILLCFPVTLQAQKKKSKEKTYKVWVTLVDGSEEKGILYDADEQGLKILKGQSIDNPNVIFIEASNINVIELRRKGKVGMGAGLGALGGIAIGAALGSAAADEDGFLSGLNEGLNIIGGAVIGGVAGTGMGAIASSSKKVFQINNHLGIYKEQLPMLQSYSIKSKEHLIVNAEK